jgi:periplasmic divalent cation tolerance protein
MIQDNIVVFCTVPSENIAKKIAGELIKNHIAACCNIVKGLTSIYFWENQVQEDNEIHPYEIPEIIALPIIRGHNKYIKWIDENVK